MPGKSQEMEEASDGLISIAEFRTGNSGLTCCSMGPRSFFPVGVLGCICALQRSQSLMLLGHYCISATASGQLFILWAESVRCVWLQDHKVA